MMPQLSAPLFGGQQGGQIDPAKLYQYQLIRELAKSGTSTAPVSSPWEGVGRLGQAAAGALGAYMMGQRQKEEQGQDAATMAQALRAFKPGWTDPGGTPTPEVAAQPLPPGATPSQPGQTTATGGGMDRMMEVLAGNPRLAPLGLQMGMNQIKQQQELAAAIAKDDASKGLETGPGGVRQRAGYGQSVAGIAGLKTGAEEFAKVLPDSFRDLYKTRNVGPGEQVYSPFAQALSGGNIPLPQGAEGLPVPAGVGNGQIYRNDTPAPAPNINVQMSADKGLATGLAEGVAKDLGTSRGQAQSAVGMLKNADVLKTLLDKGMITGTGADARLVINRALATVGVISPEQVGNTEAFQSTVGKQVLELVKGLGAGTSISNADREFAAKIAGGEISLSEQGIRRILDIGRRAAEESITTHNAGVEKQRGAPGVSESILRHYLVDQPKAGSYQVPELGDFPMPSGTGGLPPPPPGFRVVR